jgi:flagellar hook assembly protein FlgD
VDANKRVTDETDDFKQADVIYASVVTSGAAPNTNVTARWTFQDGQVVDSTTQVISPSGDAATEFHISKPGGLPKGKYKLEVLVNGTSAETEEFEVK